MAVQNVKLNVEGMTCTHCENTVMKTVGSLNGVSKVDITLENKTVDVEFDPGKISIDAIKDAITQQGYEVK